MKRAWYICFSASFWFMNGHSFAYFLWLLAMALVAILLKKVYRDLAVKQLWEESFFHLLYQTALEPWCKSASQRLNSTWNCDEFMERWTSQSFPHHLTNLFLSYVFTYQRFVMHPSHLMQMHTVTFGVHGRSDKPSLYCLRATARFVPYTFYPDAHGLCYL